MNQYDTGVETSPKREASILDIFTELHPLSISEPPKDWVSHSAMDSGMAPSVSFGGVGLPLLWIDTSIFMNLGKGKKHSAWERLARFEDAVVRGIRTSRFVSVKGHQEDEFIRTEDKVDELFKKLVLFTRGWQFHHREHVELRQFYAMAKAYLERAEAVELPVEDVLLSRGDESLGGGLPLFDVRMALSKDEKEKIKNSRLHVAEELLKHRQSLSGRTLPEQLEFEYRSVADIEGVMRFRIRSWFLQQLQAVSTIEDAGMQSRAIRELAVNGRQN